MFKEHFYEKQQFWLTINFSTNRNESLKTFVDVYFRPVVIALLQNLKMQTAKRFDNQFLSYKCLNNIFTKNGNLTKNKFVINRYKSLNFFLQVYLRPSIKDFFQNLKMQTAITIRSTVFALKVFKHFSDFDKQSIFWSKSARLLIGPI